MTREVEEKPEKIPAQGQAFCVDAKFLSENPLSTNKFLVNFKFGPAQGLLTKVGQAPLSHGADPKQRLSSVRQVPSTTVAKTGNTSGMGRTSATTPLKPSTRHSDFSDIGLPPGPCFGKGRWWAIQHPEARAPQETATGVSQSHPSCVTSATKWLMCHSTSHPSCVTGATW